MKKKMGRREKRNVEPELFFLFSRRHRSQWRPVSVPNGNRSAWSNRNPSSNPMVAADPYADRYYNQDKERPVVYADGDNYRLPAAPPMHFEMEPIRELTAFASSTNIVDARRYHLSRSPLQWQPRLYDVTFSRSIPRTTHSPVTIATDDESFPPIKKKIRIAFNKKQFKANRYFESSGS